MTVADNIYQQVKELPEPLAREVLNFIARLRNRHNDNESHDLVSAQAASLAPIWDNADDKVWDDA